MKFTKTLMAVALAGTASHAQAAPLTITSLTLTAAAFCVDGGGAVNTTCMTTGVGGSVGDGIVTGVDGTYNLVDGYHGAGTFNGGPNPASIVDMTFLNGAVNAYTAAANLGGINDPAGSIPGGPVPSGSVDFSAGTMSIDMSSWFWSFNGADYWQGYHPNIVGIVTGGANNMGHFDFIWSQYISTGSLPGLTGTWRLQGNVVAVPEASTYGMMLTGLGLVGAMVTRRRKRN